MSAMVIPITSVQQLLNSSKRLAQCGVYGAEVGGVQ
jgi:hypothetical protein